MDGILNSRRVPDERDKQSPCQYFECIRQCAISFSPEDGTVQVRARRDGGMVEITVEDDGPGIDPDKLETVFDRFYTYRPTATTSRGNNSGLGLSISREIIRAHQGEVWAENRYAASTQDVRGNAADKAKNGQEPPRLGARFTVRLPARAVAAGGKGTTMRGWRA